MKTKLLILFLLIYSYYSIGQNKKQLTYYPISNVSVEDAWPAVKGNLDFNNMEIELFNYPRGIMKSTWVEYYRGLGRYRGKFLFQFSNNKLEIEFVDIQCFSSEKKHWESSSEGLLVKTENKMRARMSMGINDIISKKDVLEKYKKSFYTNLRVHFLFYQYATELAGERWFNRYLKDKEVQWKLTFKEIKNKPEQEGFQTKYTEYYTFGYERDVLSEQVVLNGKFFITKYTDSEENLLTSKGDFIEVEGYCRDLNYSNGIFSINLTDNLLAKNAVSTIKDSSKQRNLVDDDKNFSKADEILKFKKLLDEGIISKEEFEKEKKKILSR